MEITFQLDPASMNAIDAKLQSLARNQIDEIAAKALLVGTDPLLTAAIDFCPVGNPATDIFAGLLKNSIGRAIRKKPGQVGHFIGPLRNKGVETGHGQGEKNTPTLRKTKSKKYRNAGEDTRKLPTRYAHFVEYGTSHSAPRPFMRPAFDTAGGQTCVDRTIEAFSKLLDQIQP